MRDVLLVRYGEVFLKGANRPYFLRMLTENVRKAVKPVGGHVWLSDARIYVSDFSDLQDCIARVTRVFGVHSVSPAVEMEKDLDAISAVCIRMMQGRSGTFKVFARRSDKSFPMNSMEIGQEIGGRVLESNPSLKVDVHKPQLRLNVEIRDNAYVCVEEIPAVGGMPMGTGGKAALLLSGGIDLARSGLPADEARRALLRDPLPEPAVHRRAGARQGHDAGKGALGLLRRDARLPRAVHEVPAGNPRKVPRRSGHADHPPVHDAHRRKDRAQVRRAGADHRREPRAGASQTMEALVCTDAVVEMPVFRPLIGLDKTEIMEIAEKIGTYETSILPYEDCCTVFTPRHPVTKPKLDTMPDAERKLDIDALVDEAVENTETEWVE